MYSLPVFLQWKYLIVGALLIVSTVFIRLEYTLKMSLDTVPLEESQEVVDAIAPSKERSLVLFTYSESRLARLNLEFFLKKGLHNETDFVFIFNGNTTAKELVPDRDNIRVVERENHCFDLGAIGEVLREDDLWKNYRRFITMNASIRGPFLPVYASLCWTDLFLDRLTEKIKLVGTTLNCQPSPHVQSMLWATDDVGMGLLLNPDLSRTVGMADFWGTEEDPVGLSFCPETMDQAVHSEVGSTRLIEAQGYEVDVLMTAYAGARDPGAYCRAGQLDDVLYDGKYYGSNLHPYELIFIKANRDIDPILLEKMTEWHMNSEKDSYAMCSA